MNRQEPVQENSTGEETTFEVTETTKVWFRQFSSLGNHKKSIVIALMGMAMLFFSCENNKIERIKELTTHEKLPSMEADDFESVYSDSTIIRFKMITPKLIRYELDEKEPFSEFPLGIELEKFDAQMQVISKITADYATYYDKDKKWIAQNNVIAINQKGDSLLTEELIWEEIKGRLYSDKFVKIIQEDQIITGIGFESDQDMTNWEIKKVKGTLYMNVQE